MKRIFTMICAAALMLALLCAPMTAMAEAAAAETKKGVEVTIGSMSAAQGDEIDVPITIDKNPGIWGINWKIYYDSQILRFDGIEFEDAFSDLGLLDTNEVKYPVVINGMGAELSDVTTTGVIAVIHFKVYVGVELGETEVSMIAEAGNNINVDSEDVELTVNKGIITVTEGLVSSDNKDDYPPEEPLVEKAQQNTPVGQSGKSNEGGSKWLWIIIGAVALLAVVVVIWLFSGSEEDAAETPDTKADEAAFLKLLADADTAESTDEKADEEAFLKLLDEADAEGAFEEAEKEAEDKPEDKPEE